MLTTRDNPWNPFTNFEEWYAWDISHGYHTCAYIAKIAKESAELSNAQMNRTIDDAIDEIVLYNLTGNYVKVCRKDYNSWKPSDDTTNGAKPVKD